MNTLQQEPTKVHLVYPEKKWVTAKWIETKFTDAVTNGDVDVRRFDIKTRSTQEMVRALDDAGIITANTFVYDEGYSIREMVLFGLLQNGEVLDTKFLAAKIYRVKRKSLATNQMIITRAALISLGKKMEANKENCRLHHSYREGGVPMQWWLERRKT
jgi:hypothetical protein